MMKRVCSRIPSVLGSKQNIMMNTSINGTRSMFTCSNFLRAPPMELIKQLRAETDAPLGQVRKALEESDNDINKAKEWLRQKGLQTAAKKSARSTQEGVVGIKLNGNERGVLFEVNSETDFVINSDVFKGVVDNCLEVLVKSKFEKNEYSVEQDEQSFNQQVAENSSLFENGVSIKQKFTELVAVLRENVKARRVKFINNVDSSSQLVGYLHNSKTSTMGGVGAFVIVKAAPNSTKTAEQLQSAGRQLAMHICGMGPNYLTKDQVPVEVLQHERELLIKRLEEQNMEEKKKAEEAGKEYKPKPQNILNMMIEGQLNKQFLAEHVLLLQSWVLDQKMTVQQFLKEEGIEVVDFIRMKVGEGMTYQAKKSFAEEVAEQVSK